MNAEQFSQSWMPEPYSGCWLWIRGVTSRGYGAVYHGKLQELAHRFSYRSFKGEIPQGKHVCHSCDTTICVNPSHLFLGSRSDNMRDAESKGRHHGRRKMFGFYQYPPQRNTK